MADLARPMLAEVLAALTDCHWSEEQPALWLSLPGARVEFGVVGCVEGPRDGVHFVAPASERSGHVPRDVRRAWTHADPAAAWEALATRDLIPADAVGDPGRWFVDGRPIPSQEGGGTFFVAMGRVCRAHPATHGDLVALASLGWLTIAAAEQLARETCTLLKPHGMPPVERIVWRVGERRGQIALMVDVAWTAPAGHLQDLADCLDVEGLWWPRGKDPARCEPAAELWRMGLSVDSIAAGTVTLVCPAIDGAP